MDATDKAILNRIQSDFPISSRPYAIIADEFNLSESEVINRIQQLKSSGIIRRIGGNFVPGKLGYVSTLCAAKIPENKIEVVSHGVDTNLQPINKKLARKKLNLNQDNFIIMFFGYVNWFKGSDFFAETFKNTEKILNKKVSTIIAGGESPTMKNKGFYQKYFIKVTKTVADSPVVNMTGYVAQKDLVNYFSAADLVVFPYRHFMTASGVMSLTLSYGKPFIFSNGLGEMFESSDFKKAMSEIGLRKTDISFRLSKRSCLRCAENVLLNGLKAKMSQLARIEREKRNYQNTAYLYKQIVDAETPAFIFGKRWLFHYNKGK